MDLIIWGYIFGGATIFGVIVGVFSVYNGRKTRKEICNLILSESDANRNVLSKISEGLIKLIQQTTEEHKAMINVLVGLNK